jgi:hypothetical protein
MRVVRYWILVFIFCMTERPPIFARGRITAVHDADRLYEVEMANGYRAYAIVERKGSKPEPGDPVGRDVEVHFSPYDMSRCKVVEWV